MNSLLFPNQKHTFQGKKIFQWRPKLRSIVKYNKIHSLIKMKDSLYDLIKPLDRQMAMYINEYMRLTNGRVYLHDYGVNGNFTLTFHNNLEVSTGRLECDFLIETSEYRIARELEEYVEHDFSICFPQYMSIMKRKKEIYLLIDNVYNSIPSGDILWYHNKKDSNFVFICPACIREFSFEEVIFADYENKWHTHCSSGAHQIKLRTKIKRYLRWINEKGWKYNLEQIVEIVLIYYAPEPSPKINRTFDNYLITTKY